LGELAREPAAYRWLRTAGWGFARVFSVLALALAWELAARSGAFTPYMLPALSAVLERIWTDLLTGDLLLNTGVTLYRALAGFLIGAVAGVALGMGISRNRLVNWFFDPIISVGFPMPKIAFLPVVILWLGVYDISKITMIAVEAVFPVVTATVVGIRGVERELLWSQYGRRRARAALADRFAGGAPADHHRAASGASHRAHRRHRDRDVHGRLWTRRCDEHRIAVCRFARRLRRNRRDRGDRLRAGQGHDARAPALVAVAPGGAGAKYRVISSSWFLDE
jgi:hypothetical protein